MGLPCSSTVQNPDDDVQEPIAAAVAAALVPAASPILPSSVEF